MLPNISRNLKFIQKKPKLLKKIYKGIEREFLRIDKYGNLSNNRYPKSIGYALTHKWITTDFAENMLEIITPKIKNNNKIINFLHDIHKYIIKKIKPEFIWPLSIPSEKLNSKIKLATYGNSKLGKNKKLYRIGLKKRYGLLMNMFTGIHYNFSLPKNLLNAWIKKYKIIKNNSEGYLKITRNYNRFGWIIPYIFGASPAIPSKLFRKEECNFSNIQEKYDMVFKPWATSLRLGHILTHKNKITNNINIKFNTIEEYTKKVKYALNTPSKIFQKIGLRDTNNQIQQINTNILQMESELYTQIRLKRNVKNKKSILNNLTKKGIEYLEIRSLDLNPFSPIGISKIQILFLDIFLIWCFIADSPNISTKESKTISKNWKKIIFSGRKPNLLIYNIYKNEKIPLKKIIKKIYENLLKISYIFDECFKNNNYTNALRTLESSFLNPDLTFSALIIKLFFKNKSMHNTGLKLAYKYKKQIKKKDYQFLNKQKIKHQKTMSIEKFYKKYK
ncbi:glutamate--cysteine ligase [Buchnera aphidicola (Mollitrichosiphum nigrofasciatum)]|uniref:glutamate--cysteine ligase n=1 Tax=Buchnera aphidicola TaxID=9 RepID=UPI0031B871FB